MAVAPTHARIRSYNVGFGDCFLLSFSYGSEETRHVLIDFGSTKMAARGPDGLLTVAEKIREDSGGKLHMLVATHRHSDHISGFGGKSGEVVASLKPELVVQPWTEDPDLDPEAPAPATAGDGGDGRLRARGFAARLSDMQALAAAALAEVPRLEASPGGKKTLVEQIRFLGETNIKNEDAVRNLMRFSESPTVYASFGTELPIEDLLPGVQIEVLGPPTLAQSAAIAEERRVDADEFWHLAARRARETALAGGGVKPIFPGAQVAEHRPQEARWVIPKIDEMLAEELLSIVRILDSVLNNTSLILLFHVGDSRLLFPGDAQIENWSYALFDAPDHEKIRERLAGARFYKVGHHGSLNATPKTLWNAFERRSPDATPDRLVTMVSTASGKHGSDSRGTEVPRKVLIDELERKSDLRNTQSLRSKVTFWNDAELDF